MSVTVDMREVRKLQKDLQFFNKRAMPHATRGYLNNTAFRAREIYQDGMRFDFVLKNRWTVGSVQVDKTKGYKVGSMESAVGSVQPYMLDSELGRTYTGGGKHGKAVPTAGAAGQGKNRNPRSRVVRGRNTMSAITLTRRKKPDGEDKGRNAFIAVKQAQRRGDEFLFLELEKRKGIFRIMKSGNIRMIWSMSEKSTKVEPRPLLATTVIMLEPQLDGLYADAVRFQLRRAGRLGY